MSATKLSQETQGVKERTLSSNLTLTDQAAAIQLIDCGGQSREAALPSPTAFTPHFTIVNTSDAFELLYVVDHDGYVASILLPGDADVFRSNGSDTWYSEKNGIVMGQTLLHYGCNTNLPNQNFRANGEDFDGALAAGNESTPEAAFIMPYDGIVTHMSLATNGLDGASREVALNVEGLHRGPMKWGSFPDGFWRTSLHPTQSFSAGNTLAVEKADFPNSAATCQLLVRQQSGATKFGAAVGFGADLDSVGNYARANGISTGADLASQGPLTSHPMPRAGNVVGLAWHVTGGSGNTIRIHNDTQATSVDVDISSGTEDFDTASLSFSAGDVLSLQVIGAIVGNSNFLLYTDLPGVIYSWGGNNTAVNQYFGTCSEADDGLSTTSNRSNEVMLPVALVPAALAWHVDSTGAGAIVLESILTDAGVSSALIVASISSVSGAVDSGTEAIPSGGRMRAKGSSSVTFGNAIVNVLCGPPA